MKASLRRGRRQGAPIIRLSVVVLALLGAQSGSAFGAPGIFADPDDVNLRLDVQTAEHADDGQSVTYTVVTYESFRDDFADFVWTVDKNSDGVPDLLVSAGWDDEAGPALIGQVENFAENKIADAVVSRPSGNSLRVTFPSSVLGSPGSYNYRLTAVSDVNGDGEDAPDERDLAPDTGNFRHTLGAAAQPSSQQVVAASPQPSGSPPAQPSAQPAPGSSGAPAGSPSVAPAAPAAPVGPGAAKAPAPRAARSSVAPAAPAAASPAAPEAQLARTGAAAALLAVGGAGLVIGGAPLLLFRARRRFRT